MDDQTLQYMGERVDKAREIKKNIEILKDFIKYSEPCENVELTSGNRSVEIQKYRFKRLAASAKVAVLKQVVQEIELLKQELAQL